MVSPIRTTTRLATVPLDAVLTAHLAEMVLSSSVMEKPVTVKTSVVLTARSVVMESFRAEMVKTVILDLISLMELSHAELTALNPAAETVSSTLKITRPVTL